MKVSCSFCGMSYQVNPEVFSDGSEFQCTNCPNQVAVVAPRAQASRGDARVGGDFHLDRVEMGFGEKFEMMDSTQWGTYFPAADLKLLLQYFEVYRAEADQYIFREHDTEKYLCVIVEGRVDILKDSGEETSEVLARFKSGHVFGEMALIDGQPRSASAVARKSTVLFILSQERFQDLIAEEPHTAIAIILKFSEVMSMRLRLTSGQLVKQRAEDR